MPSHSSFKKLINGEKPVLIDFHATWCGPCKALAPAVEDVARKLSDKIRVIKIDIDKNNDLASILNVRGVPTLMLYKNGDCLWRQSGVVSADHMLNIIQQKIG